LYVVQKCHFQSLIILGVLRDILAVVDIALLFVMFVVVDLQRGLDRPPIPQRTRTRRESPVNVELRLPKWLCKEVDDERRMKKSLLVFSSQLILQSRYLGVCTSNLKLFHKVFSHRHLGFRLF